MTRKILTATRWIGPQTGTVYYGLFDPDKPTDAQRLAYETKKHGAVSAQVEIDFDPATSQALNRPARELVEVERDRLADLLREVRGAVDAIREAAFGTEGLLTAPEAVEEALKLCDRIDAALPTDEIRIPVKLQTLHPVQPGDVESIANNPALSRDGAS